MRVGVLKGGAAAGEQTTGLDEAAFYASLCAGGYPTPSQQCAKLYDRQTLGVSVRAGDAIEARNAAQRSSTRTSAERARARPRTHATATDDATGPYIEACVPAPQRAPTTSRASSRRARCLRRCVTRRRSRSRSRRRRAIRHRLRASGTRCFCAYEPDHVPWLSPQIYSSAPQPAAAAAAHSVALRTAVKSLHQATRQLLTPRATRHEVDA